MSDIRDSICRRTYPRSSGWRNKGELCPLIPASPRGFITIFHSGSIYAEENGRKRAERSQCAASWAAARLDQTRQRKLWLHQNRSELNLSRCSWNLRKREIIISLFLIKNIFRASTGTFSSTRARRTDSIRSKRTTGFRARSSGTTALDDGTPRKESVPKPRPTKNHQFSLKNRAVGGWGNLSANQRAVFFPSANHRRANPPTISYPPYTGQSSGLNRP